MIGQAQQLVHERCQSSCSLHLGCQIERALADRSVEPDQILDQQLEQFRGLVAEVKRINPLYRERFAGVEPEALRTPEDIASFLRIDQAGR